MKFQPPPAREIDHLSRTFGQAVISNPVYGWSLLYFFSSEILLHVSLVLVFRTNELVPCMSGHWYLCF